MCIRDSVNSVSKSEVEQAAKLFVDNNVLSIVLVGDKNLLKDKISNFNIEVVEVDTKGKSL